MSNSNGKITTPISMTGDIRAVLGESAMDFIGLCTSQKVNMWSKVKPGRITTRAYTSLLALCKAAQADTRCSVYWSAPTGSYNMTGMWDGYNHNAKSPYQSWVFGDLQGYAYRYGLETAVNGAAAFYANSGAEVGVAALGLTGYYAAIAIADSALTKVGLVTCTSTWGAAVTDGTGQMCTSQPVESALLSTSEARLCFPVLAAAQSCSTELKSDISGTFYAVPLAAKSVTLKVVAATHKAYMTIDSATRDGWTITLKMTPHVVNTAGTGKATTWAAGDIPYTMAVQYGQTYSSYSFAASSTGTWSGGDWTGAPVTHYLTAHSTTTGENYIQVTAFPAVSYIATGTAASVPV